ncbi:MAG: hypothetical protein A2Z62_00150 [Candidatus Terrybacteria bacterium RIFCSPLOWO2_02_42_20]|uniref:t-SNARE coiled-coil homology domain-containing protein n=2 Tax=Candidatus Terryibacteriota TaxID=1817920 RepID=A0A1G2PNI5_9BACT|nr:MAG: hypothetical protein A2W59_00360 [Candidatus Terrybacteria bacterium RIFCSPHIGHO2_02_41_19]OHA54757.1 MAG: hypothetical protein A2Z62_00150 [Candidatus Terrybacteria bacterium RIFCSPLOWO2_02_42_20]
MNKKRKIKKLKLPLSKMTGNEKDYTAVLLEDVNSNMKAFWEVLSGVKERGDATFEQVGLMTEKIDGIEIRLDSIEGQQTETNKRLDSIEGQQTETNKRLDSIEFKLDDLMKEVSSIKEEIKVLKTALSSKADKEKLEILEFKIVRIERHLKLA